MIPSFYITETFSIGVGFRCAKRTPKNTISPATPMEIAIHMEVGTLNQQQIKQNWSNGQPV